MFRLLWKEQNIYVKKKLNKQNCVTSENNEIKSFFWYIQEELKKSTIHGFFYIFNSSINLVGRILWLFSFIGSVLFMAVLLSAQYTRFIKSPTVMSVEMNYFDWNISYPAITLCPLHKSDSVLYKNLLDEIYYRTGLKTDTYLWSIVCGSMDNLDIIYLDIPANISSLFHPSTYSKLAAENFKKFPNDSLTTNSNWNISLDTAMTEMGMCHVINSNVAMYDNPYNWHRHDKKYARTNVELTIYEGDFLAQITNYTYNYKIFLHHPDEVILSSSPSFTIDEEGLVSLGLSVWSTRIADEIRKMSISWRNCRFVNEPLNKRYPVYSYNHCILECRIGIILHLCGCVPHFYKPLAGERVCSINELKCVQKYKKEIMSLKIPKNVKKRYPYFHKPEILTKNCGCLSNCETDIYLKDNENVTYAESITRLQIGITSFPKTRVVRDIIFHGNDILLRSGGVVNLFIGSSMISIIELLVIATKLFAHFVCKCFSRNSS